MNDIQLTESIDMRLHALCTKLDTDKWHDVLIMKFEEYLNYHDILTEYAEWMV